MRLRVARNSSGSTGLNQYHLITMLALQVVYCRPEVKPFNSLNCQIAALKVSECARLMLSEPLQSCVLHQDVLFVLSVRV